MVTNETKGAGIFLTKNACEYASECCDGSCQFCNVDGTSITGKCNVLGNGQKLPGKCSSSSDCQTLADNQSYTYVANPNSLELGCVQCKDSSCEYKGYNGYQQCLEKVSNTKSFCDNGVCKVYTSNYPTGAQTGMSACDGCSPPSKTGYCWNDDTASCEITQGNTCAQHFGCNGKPCATAMECCNAHASQCYSCDACKNPVKGDGCSATLLCNGASDSHDASICKQSEDGTHMCMCVVDACSSSTSHAIDNNTGSPCTNPGCVGCHLVDITPPTTCSGNVTVPSSLGWKWGDACTYTPIVNDTGDFYVCPISEGGGDCIVGNDIPATGNAGEENAWKSLQVCASDGKTPCVKCSDYDKSGYKQGSCCGYINQLNFNSGLPPCVDSDGNTCKAVQPNLNER